MNARKKLFLTENELYETIKSQIWQNGKEFEWRDFVNPLVGFCLDENYSARIGIVYGLRSTGKTVGMLQAANTLLVRNKKVAYARFDYNESEMLLVNDEIEHLSKNGYTHFFIDEAPYLSGFMTDSAKWADTYVPKNKIKIIISGTDSFELWLTMTRALYHRAVCFSTNRNTFPEYQRILGKDFDSYKENGGIFLQNEDEAVAEVLFRSKANANMSVEKFIKDAVVDNLLHTLTHYNKYYDTSNYYTDWLYAIDEQVIFKGVIAILKSVVEPYIRKNFIEIANKKVIPNLGDVLSKWLDAEKTDIKEQIANSIGFYQNSIKIENASGSIDALIEFLIKVGCLIEGATGISDEKNMQRTLYFAHNVLMNYAVRETKRAIRSIKGIDSEAFAKSLEQAAEGSMIENIVLSHLIQGAKKNEKVFRYHDPEEREVDAVIVDREARTIRLIEVKSAKTMTSQSAYTKKLRHLFDKAILNNIGVDESFVVTRVLAYQGTDKYTHKNGDILLLMNIENILSNHHRLAEALNKFHDYAKTQIERKQNKEPEKYKYTKER
jgi:predicted AAA+ superfamily ATPase